MILVFAVNKKNLCAIYASEYSPSTLTRLALTNISFNSTVIPFSEPYFTPPRILSCLHVFCESCLDKLFDESADLQDGQKSIRCTICQQVTNVRVVFSNRFRYVFVRAFSPGEITFLNCNFRRKSAVPRRCPAITY